MSAIKILDDTEYFFKDSFITNREETISANVYVFKYQRKIFILLEKDDDSRFLKICLNDDELGLLYFENYDNYVDYKNIGIIAKKVLDHIQRGEFTKDELDPTKIKKYSLATPIFSLHKDDLVYCFRDEKYNYSDGVKHVRFYSDYASLFDETNNKELLLFLIKYGKSYEYCIMSDNLEKIAKYVFEKNISTGKFILIRNEHYHKNASEISFEKLNNEFKKISDMGSKQELNKNNDYPTKHGSCGFHFYHFFSISDYFSEFSS